MILRLTKQYISLSYRYGSTKEWVRIEHELNLKTFKYTKWEFPF